MSWSRRRRTKYATVYRDKRTVNVNLMCFNVKSRQVLLTQSAYSGFVSVSVICATSPELPWIWISMDISMDIVQCTALKCMAVKEVFQRLLGQLLPASSKNVVQKAIKLFARYATTAFRYVRTLSRSATDSVTTGIK